MIFSPAAALKMLGHMFHLDDQTTAGLDTGRPQLDVALVDALRLFLTHFAQPAHAALVAFTPRGQAFAHPQGFADDAAVDPVLFRRLGGHHRFRPLFETGITLVGLAQDAAVEP